MKYVISAVSFVLVATAVSAWAQGPSVEPTLSVEGTGVVRAAPDMATVRLGIVADGERASDVQQEVNRVAASILAAVRSQGVRDSDVQTARLRLFPRYAPAVRGETSPRIDGYQAANTVTIRVDDLDRVGRIVDAALGAGANQLEGVTFGLDDDTDARERALRQAVEEARSKARVMADALDVELEEVLSVNEGGIFIQPPVMGVMEARMAVQADAPTPVSPGEVEVRASVSIRYRIDQ